MAGLVAHVHVQDEKGETHVFGPGSDVPAWAKKQITNPAAWGPEVDDETSDPSEPPRGGKGSGIEVWREYATETLQLTVPEDATKDEIITLVDASKPQE
jgi:hypothetical protein